MKTHLTASLALIASAGLAATVQAQPDTVPLGSNNPESGLDAPDRWGPHNGGARGNVPAGPVSTDLGLIAEANTVVIASAITINNPAFRFNLAIFDQLGEVVGFANSASTSSVNLILQLPTGTYYLASWGGFGVPSSGWEVPIAGVGTGLNAQIFGDVHTAGLGDLDSDARFFRFYVGEPSIDPTGVVVTTRADFRLETTDANFDTELGLYDETGRILAANDSGGPGQTSRIRFRDRPAGRYFVSVSGDETDHENRFLADPFANSESGQTSLFFGDEMVELVSVATNEVAWTDFRVRDEGPDIQIPGDVPEIQTVRIDMTDSGSLRPDVALYFAGSGDLIAEASGSNLARIDRALQPGDYIIAANGDDTEYDDGFVTIAEFNGGSDTTGPYELKIGATTITGQEIESGGDTDFYRFTVEATIDLGEIAEGPQAFTLETSSADPDLDTEMALYSSDGLVRFEDDDGGAGGLSRLDFPDGFLRGNYFVAVAGSDTVFRDGFRTDVGGDGDTGGYDLEYTGLSRQSGLGFAGDVDFYSFEIGQPTDLGVLGTPGEVVSIDTFTSQFDTVIAVWDENGVLLEVNDDDISTGESRIRRVYAPGVYHFGVTGTGATFDDGFRIDVDAAGPLGDYGGFAVDVPYAGRTAVRDRFDLFRFEIAGGCNAADLAGPFGVLDLADINLFVSSFTTQSAAGDIDGNGIFDLTDINLFVTAFTTGCP